MGFFENSGLLWLNDTSRVTDSKIEEREGTVVRSTDNDIVMLVVESHRAKWRWGEKCFFWEIRVIQIPDVRLLWHVFRHLLESKHSIGNTDSHLGGIWVPSDTCNGSFDIVWVFEDHEGLGGDVLTKMLSGFTREILFEEINLVVLSDALGDTLDHFLGGL